MNTFFRKKFLTFLLVNCKKAVDAAKNRKSLIDNKDVATQIRYRSN